MGELLDGLRVVDLTVERGRLAARVLADLGAQVVRVEGAAPSGAGGSSRMVDGVDLGAFVRSAGVDRVELDPGSEHDRIALHAVLDGADVALVSDDSWGDPDSLVADHPQLVVVALTATGRVGAGAEWPTTELVEQAMAGFVVRAGVPELPPVSAPGRMADDMGAVLGVLGALVALTEVADGAPGQVVDVSAVLALAHCTDMSLPLWSTLGMPPQRVGAGSYPLYACTDGLARLVLPMSAGEWRSLITWLGSPEEWTGGEWDEPMLGPSARAAIIERLPAMFAAGTRDELAAQGDRYGVRITPVLTPAEVLASAHVAARATFAEVEVADGVVGRLVASPFSVDGERRPPRPGKRLDGLPSWSDRPAPTSDRTDRSRPLEGLRVLEIGTGVAAPEGARMLAEWGAEVIKIESSTRPDFQRTVLGGTINPAYVTVGRGKRSFDVDLTTDEGRALVLDLVAASDVLVENNATDVMARLGLGWDVLRERNPRLVMVSTQLYGDRGPWAAKKGYGPSARAIGGLTWLWAHGPDAPRGVMTIHPDHLAGRLVAIAALAGLRQRARTGTGTRIDLAQFEAVILFLAEHYLHESLESGAAQPVGNIDPRHAPWGIYRCGDDDGGIEAWMAICVRNDSDWESLRRLAPDEFATDEWRTEATRVAERDAVDDAVARWLATRNAGEVERLLVDAGVPASRLLHPRLLADHPVYRAWGWPAPVEQPGIGPLLLEGPALEGSRMGRPSVRPAALLGADTEDIARALLGLDPARVAELRASGVLGAA